MIVAIVAMFITGGQGASTPPPPGWSLRVDPAHCTLERRSVDPVATLSIDTTPGSDHFRVALAGGEVRGPATLHPAVLSFAPSGTKLAGLATVATLTDGTRVAVMQGVATDLLPALAMAEGVSITSAKGVAGTIATPGAAKAIEALRRCTTDQLVGWGADPAQFVAGGTPAIARTDRDDWISNAQLIAIAGQSRRNAIGDDFRLVVDTIGKVAECHALSPQTEPGVERIACGAVLGKPMFTPARSPAGVAVRGAATFRVAFLRHAR